MSGLGSPRTSQWYWQPGSHLKQETPAYQASQTHNPAHYGVGAVSARVRWVRDISDRCRRWDLGLCEWLGPRVDWSANASVREAVSGQETSLWSAISAARTWDLVELMLKKWSFAIWRDDVVMTCCGGGGGGGVVRRVGRTSRIVGWRTRAEKSKPIINDRDQMVEKNKKRV